MRVSRSFGRVAAVAAIVVLAVAAPSCSPVLNTFTGLTTPQSTISGSNYVMGARESDGCLVARDRMQSTSGPIGANDRFAIDLDFAFVRYFQAVDPYVLGFAASWMGKKAAPVDSEKLHQQIFLHKEGVGQNGRLPITGVPLVGPVTMGEDEMPVHVTVKIVTLSKYDNAQTIALIDKVTSTAAAAQPQYALAANAAGALGAAIVEQNRDKIEFEHTFTFWPAGTDLPPSTHYETQLVLRPGRWVVVKGENEDRAIPYQTWYYYIWPFNWLGHSPAGEARRLEAEHAWHYCPAPPNESDSPALNGLRSVPWFLSCFPRVPFYLLGDLLLAGGADFSSGRPLTQLHADADYLTWNAACYGGEQYAKNARRGTPPLSTDAMQTIPGGDGWNVYSEKSHIAISVRRTEGSYGDFDTLATELSSHAIKVNELTTNRAEFEERSNATLKKAFDAIRDAAVAEKAKNDASKRIAKGGDVSGENFCATGLDCTERGKLVDAAVEKQRRETLDTIVEYAVAFLKEAKTDEEKQTVFTKLLPFVKDHKWAAPKTGVEAWNCQWQAAWKRVISDAKSRVQILAPTATVWKPEEESDLQKLGTTACENPKGCTDCPKQAAAEGDGKASAKPK